MASFKKPAPPTGVSASTSGTFRRHPASPGATRKAPTGPVVDEDEEEDRAMERNPSDRPFPTFQPTEADAVRKKKRAIEEIRDMVHGLKAVVPFSKPDMSGVRPPWHSDVFVARPPVPKLDRTLRNDLPPPTSRAGCHSPPTIQQPKWVNHLSIPLHGCPQLGLPMVQDNSHKIPLRKGGHFGRVEYEASSQTARTGQSIKKLLHTASMTPRFAIDHRDDIMLELIRDQAFVKEIHHHAKQRKSVLVTLPKLGVRLFSFNGAPSLAECIRGASPPERQSRSAAKDQKAAEELQASRSAAQPFGSSEFSIRMQ